MGVREMYENGMCEQDVDYPKTYKDWVNLVNQKRGELKLSPLNLPSGNKCSFCGKSENQVDKLILAKFERKECPIGICNECINLFHE